MADESVLKELFAGIEENNNRVALLLSLRHNEPDDKGVSRIEQERRRLNKINRDSWDRTKDPIGVGAMVLIPVGVPVGVGVNGSYITEKPLQGTLTDVSGLYGGEGFRQAGNRLIEPLFKVSVELPRTEGQAHTEAVTLLVPNDLLARVVPDGSTNSAPIA